MLIRLGGLSAVVGALWLASTVLVLTIVQRDFMRELGWDAFSAPTLDWPSGLALGPQGAWMTAAFLGCGLLLAIFAQAFSAYAVRFDARAQPALGLTLSLTALGMAGLAFATDPTLTTTTPTWHGRLHDAAYIVMGIGLTLSYCIAAVVFRGTKSWFALLCVCALVTTIVGFALKGLAFYGMLGVVIAWFMSAGVVMMVAEGERLNGS